MAAKRAKLEVYRSEDGDWRWRLVARNGEILAWGEGYTRKSGALRGINALMRSAAEALIVVPPP